LSSEATALAALEFGLLTLNGALVAITISSRLTAASALPSTASVP